MSIAVIGGGRIGEALVAGLIDKRVEPGEIRVAEPVAGRAAELAQRYGVSVSGDVGAAARGAAIVVVAVKPNDVEAVAVDIAKVAIDDTEQLVVSLAAGVRTERLEARLPEGSPVVRVMPNTPMLVGAGMSAIAAGAFARPQHLERVSELLGSLGRVVTVAESQMDAVTAVSGSGPAYFFLVVEAMVDGAVSLGLPRDVATTLVAQTLVGAAAMLDGTGDSPVDLRAAVTSPGGTTAAAVRVLEGAGVRAAFIEALHAAARRSTELGLPVAGKPQ
jgi:pyrroline-5-carboxylate reductase